MDTLTIIAERLRDRLVAADPGLLRTRRAGLAVGGIVFAIAVLGPLGRPIPTIMVAAIAAMQCAFTVNDKEPRAQAITLVLAVCSGTVSLTVAALGVTRPPLDSVLFIVVIFCAVYAQRFAPRGPALGGLAFFMFFFSMFLQIHLAQLPQYILSLAIGAAGNALMRFVVLRRDAGRELVRIRAAFRARLGRHAAAAAAYLASGGSERRRNQLRRADERLHEAVLMIEDAINEVLDPPDSERLRRRVIEVEIAAQWLSITARRANTEKLPGEVRDELVGSLLRFESLIEHDPRELPVISDTDEFSRMLVTGSRISGKPAPGDDLRRAIAELALADVNAQRIAEHDYSAEAEVPEAEQPAPKRFFAFDNQARAALQAMIGGALAVLGGELVSHQRWYWAVLTVFVVFLNTSTAGATFVKGFRRVLGTLAGIFGGMLLALLVTGNLALTVVLILVCVFCLVYMARVSQVVMAFFVTCMLGLLYSMLGTFTIDVLWLRVAETAVGAAAGILAAIIVLPVRTRTVLRSDLEAVLDDLHEFLDEVEALLSGRENVNVIELTRELDRSSDKVRTTVEPLTHPMSLSSRRDYGSRILTTLDRISFRARHIAARAEPGLLAGDDRLTEQIDRITHNVEVLKEAVGGGTQRKLDRDPETAITRDSDDRHVRSVLNSLSRLDEGVVALGRVFQVPVAESVKPDVGRRTGSAQAGTDRVRTTSEENVRRSTQ
ncbi:putative membrane protein YccC [Amycolatopsis bartoniae]|uniref:FUSC family protein n=1 Tax=Amycolatopsis bartoniae TaxID=941986 RepID=A0A8H9IXB2_9PSEU|nr:FUSC family protein [Amycolatopsis bartoniae]MBB2937092.1 putative membrane protein YccC [Amycolatopsis bartoniae]TVT04750.1 FUSC family protein [Amycolatopsis bartoniae]GHF52380.1 FUSC family protein [Amycolatopsis bartoniae]